MTNTATSNIGHNRPELDPHNLRCSDIGNAEVFADQHEDKLRYCFELGRWFHWDGSVWTPEAEAHLDKLAEMSVMSFPGEASELMDARTREEFMKWAIRSGSRQRMKAMVDQSRHRLSIDKEKLDPDGRTLSKTMDEIKAWSQLPPLLSFVEHNKYYTCEYKGSDGNNRANNVALIPGAAFGITGATTKKDKP